MRRFTIDSRTIGVWRAFDDHRARLLVAAVVVGVLLLPPPRLHAACQGGPSNNVREGVEQCDGGDLDGFTCADFCGTGTLACNPDCTFRLTSCAVCGNGALDPGELCDGTLLPPGPGSSCPHGGTMACLPDCSSLDDSGCYACGNGRREGSEIGGTEFCDGNDVGTATCASGPSGPYHGGVPGCTGSCTLDYGSTYCWKCGDGALQGYEECDAGTANGTEGNNCDATCHLRCGNGAVEQGEQCDDGARVGGDGCSPTCLFELGGVYPGGTTGDTCNVATPACVDACYAGWGASGIAAPAATTDCTDGAACDQDHAVNGTCVIQYSYCLNTVPQGTILCTIRDVKRVALVTPPTDFDAVGRTAFLDSVDLVLRRFSGTTTRDADGVTRTTRLDRGDVCGSARVSVGVGSPRRLAVATIDSGNPFGSGSNTRTDRDEIVFRCMAP